MLVGRRSWAGQNMIFAGCTAKLKNLERLEKVVRVRAFELVKVLIVYDTVSPSKATAIVAETIGGVLKEKEIEVDSFFVADADMAVVQNHDCLLAGAPTMRFRASTGIMQFLDGLPSAAFSGRLAAAFDTQVQSRISGSAVKGIEGKLKDLGFKLFKAPLIVYVEGKLRQNEWHLKEGELEKAKKWAEEAAEALLE
jgi:flavorubredoxin